MNWQTIKHIYRCVLIHNWEIEYLGDDKYKITGHYTPGKKLWAGEFRNGHRDGKYICWNEDGTIRYECEYNGDFIA